MIEYLMNRRLGETQDLHPSKRYKTADTKISNSRKLPRDFFSNSSKKTLSSPLSMSHQSNSSSLPSLKKLAGKSKSTELPPNLFTQKSPNFQITFRPSSQNEKWKLPSISYNTKPESEKIKRVSRTRMHMDVKFSFNAENQIP